MEQKWVLVDKSESDTVRENSRAKMADEAMDVLRTLMLDKENPPHFRKDAAAALWCACNQVPPR